MSDLNALLARRHDNGGDFWASEDGRVYVGNPFSTIGCLVMLSELGVAADHEAVAGALDLVADAIRPDGRIRVAPKAPMYPCYTAEAARALARFRPEHPDLDRVVGYFLDDHHESGGWRCSFTRFGKGPETECASPGATLYALDFLRFRPELRAGNDVVDRSVAFLLDHWDRRDPIGPCHHGIGSTFLQVEYPFLRYTLFYWVYVLSFFGRARDDDRFRAAQADLAGRLDDDGSVVVEGRHRNLSKLAFCARGEVSESATARYRELEANLGG